LVVDAHEQPERGYWGEVLTTAAEARGLVGLVIDGGVRDVSAVEAHGFPIFSALVALPGATKRGGGTVGGPARVGGVAVATGDWVVGDADGVTVVAGEELDLVLSAAGARADKETAMFDRLRQGATTLELLGLDPRSVERSGD
jgi:4-hydroxy-4-methyl-2-oxoglutarate aldolase